MFRLLFFFLLTSSSNSYKITKLKINKLPFNLKENSLWVSYPVNTNSIQNLNNMIPKSHYLYKCKVFEEDLPKYRLFYNIFEVKTPFFHGNRMEVVTLIKNRFTHETSFVVLDCFTDAMAWDPIDGVKQSNAIFKKENLEKNNYVLSVIKKGVNKKGNKESNKIFSISAEKSKLFKKPLKKFSIESNYLCFFKNHTEGFKLEFDENEIDVTTNLLKDYKIENNVYSNYIQNIDNVFIYTNNMKFTVIIKK